MHETPDPGRDIVTDRRRPSNIWTRGVYYEGLMALNELDRNPRFTEYAVAWGEHHRWGLRNGAGSRSADDQCCGQAYLELYVQDPRPERIRDIKASVDQMVAGRRVNDWWWVDALQMAMPVFARLGVITHDPNYFLKMHELYVATRDGSGTWPALYNPRERLWWRDRSFVPPYREPNGAGCYWSRGNGWVMAALVRVLDLLPADAPDRGDYVRMLQDMAGAVAAAQRPDGFWNVSLRDPDHFGGRELTGTALFTYALAAGIREGVLAADAYRPAAVKAWKAMSASAVHPDGFLGYVQGTGKQPSDGQPVTFDHRPDFQDFGVGCFLLAGSEIFRAASGTKSSTGP